jgi:predicted lipoprotein
MKKIVKWIIVLLVVALLGYKSVYIQKLSEVKKDTGKNFDAVAFSKRLWTEQLPAKLDSAIALTELIKLIEANPSRALQNHSHAMAIGNYRYSLVKATGKVAVVSEDEMIVQVPHADSAMNVRLATEYVYGNAIRDASGLLDIKDFTSTTELNNVSEELNKTIRKVVLPEFKKQVKAGDSIEVTGAVEINQEHIRLNELELIPARLKILP